MLCFVHRVTSQQSDVFPRGTMAAGSGGKWTVPVAERRGVGACDS